MGHYYEQVEGVVHPRHFVTMTSDPSRTRPTRVSDARKHGWSPSVTTLLNIMDRPGLNRWRVRQHLETALVVAQELEYDCSLVGCPPDYFSKQVEGKTEQRLAEAPDRGTQIHDYLEWFLSGDEGDAPLLTHWLQGEAHDVAYAVEKVLADNCGDLAWVCEQRFLDERGFAGMVDLHCDRSFEEGGGWVVDFKSTGRLTSEKKVKLAYPDSHAIQLAAYRQGLGIPHARCANIFISTEEPGLVEWFEWDEETLEREWQVFLNALAIWQLRNFKP